MAGKVTVVNKTGDPDTYPNGVDLDVTIEVLGVVTQRKLISPNQTDSFDVDNGKRNIKIRPTITGMEGKGGDFYVGPEFYNFRFVVTLKGIDLKVSETRS